MLLASFSGPEQRLACFPAGSSTGNGWHGRDRTYDHLINSQTLLPLSYAPFSFFISTTSPARYPNKNAEVSISTSVQFTGDSLDAF